MNLKLKILESLVRQAIESLTRLQGENKRLAADNRFLNEEVQRLQDQLRNLRNVSLLQERARAKIERIYHKLEKATHASE